jgi:hypothetical protein
MSAAQNRFKQAPAPSGGSAAAPAVSVGAQMPAAQNRFKQAPAPSGGSAAALAANVGAQ